MAYLISTLFFIAITIWAMVLGGGINYFWDFPSFLLVIPPAIAFGVSASSMLGFKQCLILSFTSPLSVEKTYVAHACQFAQVTGKSAVYLGVFFTLLGWISMATHIKPDEFSLAFGHAFAISFLTILYGLAIKLLCYIAEQKIRFNNSYSS